MDAETIGGLIPLAVTGLACVICAILAFGAEPRSRRLAGLALTCGLAFLPALSVLIFARGPGSKVVFFAVGAGVVAAGVVAVVLSVWSMTARKADGGTATTKPLVAIALGGLSVLLGIGAAMMPIVTAVGGPGDGTPWAHRVDPPGFEITLPSSAWRNANDPREIVRLGCPHPAMVVGVKEVRPTATAAEFERVVNELKRFRANSAVAPIEEKRERNPQGHDHWVFLGEENGASGRILVAISVTWWNKTHAVIMFFEGQHRMKSQAGQGQESETFRAAARSVLSSVK